MSVQASLKTSSRFHRPGRNPEDEETAHAGAGYRHQVAPEEPGQPAGERKPETVAEPLLAEGTIRIPGFGGGATSVYMYFDYAWGFRSSGNWQFGVTADALAPA